MTQVGIAHGLPMPFAQLLEAAVQHRRAVGRIRQVAAGRVPGLVALEEGHLVAAPGEFAHQAAERRRMAIAP
jgi:hypothetical protein